MSTSAGHNKKPLVVRPDQGRKYDMGRMRAVFFADEHETAARYSINAPAGFEKMMPNIIEWFAENPLGDVSDA